MLGFGVEGEVGAGLAGAIGESADLAAETDTRSASLAGGGASAAPVDSPTPSLLFILTCDSAPKHVNKVGFLCLTSVTDIVRE